jgi:hypothetical protein
MYAITNSDGEILLDEYGEVMVFDDALTARYVAQMLMLQGARTIRWDVEIDADDALEVV